MKIHNFFNRFPDFYLMFKEPILVFFIAFRKGRGAVKSTISIGMGIFIFEKGLNAKKYFVFCVLISGASFYLFIYDSCVNILTKRTL